MKTIHAVSCAALLAWAAPMQASAQSSPWVPEVESPQYFAVWVEDVDRAVEWYRMVFGLDDLGGSEAEDGRWRIANVGNESLLVEIIRDNRAEAVEFARGFGKVGFHVPDVGAVADRVEQATGERPRVLTFEPMNQRLLQIHDPDGNTIQLFTRIDGA